MIVDNPLADRQAEAGAFVRRLRREEGIEDARQDVGSDPVSRVGDLDEDVLAIERQIAYRYPTLPNALPSGIDWAALTSRFRKT